VASKKILKGRTHVYMRGRDIPKEIQNYMLLLYSSNYGIKNPAKINIRDIIRAVHKEMQYNFLIHIRWGTALQDV
jgi:hypothetical protein